MQIRELFTVLQEIAGRARLDPGLESVILVELTGPDPAHWQGRISGGKIELAEGAPDKPDLTVTASSATAIGIFEKTVNPLAAFMTGQIKVKGDLNQVALLKQLLLSKKKP